MKKNNIYLILQGRIGNQLFQYAFARKIQNEKGNNSKIIIDDSRVLKLGWENSLKYYNLPNVKYCHKDIVIKNLFSTKIILREIYKLISRKMDYMKKYQFEKSFNKHLNKHGAFICENGFLDYNINYNKSNYLEGYFQSEKYFIDIKDDIKSLFAGSQFDELEKYPNLEKIRLRNSVCISIKIEHNVGSSLYSVCDINYWKKAIDYIIENVEKPLFFICSDNVDYVLANLIDANQFDYIVQDRAFPVHVSLAAMSECKHFIIGNTTFGWWAQYMSENQGKIVVAPSKWMLVDMPIDIYQDNWKLIDVEEKK